MRSVHIPTVNRSGSAIIAARLRGRLLQAAPERSREVRPRTPQGWEAQARNNCPALMLSVCF